MQEYEEIPSFYWPPPKSSAYTVIPQNFMVKPNAQTYLEDVAKILEHAFNQAGYGEKSWYSVPGGFALASRLEQIYPDGTSKEVPNRWSLKISPPHVFTLQSYIKALFKADPGHYRVIVFVVTSYPFNQEFDSTMSLDEARDWVAEGTNVLPAFIGNHPFSNKHNCTALIYEFKQATPDHEAVFMDPSALTGIIHLKKAKLMSKLERYYEGF